MYLRHPIGGIISAHSSYKVHERLSGHINTPAAYRLIWDTIPALFVSSENRLGLVLGSTHLLVTNLCTLHASHIQTALKVESSRVSQSICMSDGGWCELDAPWVARLSTELREPTSKTTGVGALLTRSRSTCLAKSATQLGSAQADKHPQGMVRALHSVCAVLHLGNTCQVTTMVQKVMVARSHSYRKRRSFPRPNGGILLPRAAFPLINLLFGTLSSSSQGRPVAIF
ncbi:hypothetical protein KC353_g7 [Hortaea werneckii]|nr:hypothetical protein KC353_g7 [Hortaea werneckii]